MAALFFALHPIHVEVAAWVSAVSEAVLAASLMAALVCVAKYAARKDWRWLAGALLFYASALLTKETAMVFPAVVFAYAWLSPPGASDPSLVMPSEVVQRNAIVPPPDAACKVTATWSAFEIAVAAPDR